MSVSHNPCCVVKLRSEAPAGAPPRSGGVGVILSSDFTVSVLASHGRFATPR